MADKKNVTKKPSGLTLARKGKRFIAKWKIADKDYGDGQDVQYRITHYSWTGLNGIGTKTTKKAFSVKTNLFYPNSNKKLTYVDVRVQGNRKRYQDGNAHKDPDASGWRSKRFDVLPPDNPKVTVTVGTWPTSTFKWKTENDNTAHKWFTDVEYQHVLLVNSNKKPAELTENEWAGTASNARDAHSGTSNSADSSIDVTEDSSTFEIGKSYTRYFRIRSRGPAGAQTNDKGKADVWAYGKHVYADSQQAKIIDTIVEKNDEVSGYTCQVKFTATITRMFPIDKIITQYALAIPTEGLEPPDGISWSDGLVSIPKNSVDDENSAIFTIDQLPSVDQCLFVRVNTVYDDRTTYGVPLMVDYGRLAAPTGLSVQTDSTTHRATVMATNNSQITDSFLEVLFITKKHPNGKFIGIIPNGETRTVVQCPQWDDEDEVSFGVRAVVSTSGAEYVGEYLDRFRLTEDTLMQIGKTYYQRFIFGRSEYFLASTTYNAETNPNAKGWYELPENTVVYLEVSYQMSSPIVTSGGDVPVAPKNVTAVMYDNNGTIRVTWDWAWEIADRAEVSWSDHEDAWESTDEPATYIVSKMKASALNISGLETGIKWWVRVRLIAGLEDDATYGAYAYANGGVPVNLASAPAIPAVEVSEPVITVDGTTTVSWGYVTTDGTEQLAATIAEILSNGQIREIATVGSEYYYDLNAAEQGWSYGETHQIVVSVVSQSGRASDDWSIPVPVTIAEPLTCEITQTSLVMQTNEINPEVYTDDLVTFETDTEQPVTRLSVDLEPIQNLNGYDHPWVGGAGKNILKPTQRTATASGVTYTVAADGKVTLSGTATADDSFTMYSGQFLKDGGTYTCSLYGATNAKVNGRESYAVIVAAGTSPSSLVISITNGTVYDESFFVQIEKGSTATAYEPYENICPISGWNGVSVTRAGDNLLPLDTGYPNKYLNGTGGLANLNGAWASDFIAVKATPYIAKSNDADLMICTYDVNKSFIARYYRGTNYNRAMSFTPQTGSMENVRYVRLSHTAAATASGESIQFNFGTTATAYEPYTGETITQEFVDGQGNTITVYGGEHEFVGGVLTVTNAIKTYNGTEDWMLNPNGVGRFYLNALPPGLSMTDKAASISNQGTYWDNAQVYGSYFGFGSSGIYSNKISENDTLDAFKARIAENNLQVVYPLATPITYTLTPQQVETLIGTNNIWSDAGEVTVRTPEAVEDGYALKAMPLTATVTGVGNAGVTTLIVERAEEYETERPDESDQVSFMGETVVLARSDESAGSFEINNDSPALLGRFDDGAQYRLIATVTDNLGQKATSEPIDFIVDWTDQAIIPEAEAAIDNDWMMAVLTPIAPEGARDTDTCDIYRLSVDKPELICRGAQFGEQYVDPYPAIGQFGGHRFVLVTENGDYITEDQEYAWTDTDAESNDNLDTEYSIIDFGRGRVMLDRNVNFSNEWSKNFKETHYLDGSVEGDWINDGVSRSGGIDAVAITLIDQETIESMRRLATYVGECHVRTSDGSSFAANVDVQENYSHDTGKVVASFSLRVTRVDPQALDGLTYHEWRKIHNGEL